jgi:phage terminase Nu1 subunit (DNA packaging protein)
MFGALHAERLRKTSAEADGVEMANAVTRADYLDRRQLSRALAEVADSIVQIVRVSRLTRQEQDDLLPQLSSIPVIIENAARAQTKWRGNGAMLQPAATETPKRGPGRPRKRENTETAKSRSLSIT